MRLDADDRHIAFEDDDSDVESFSDAEMEDDLMELAARKKDRKNKKKKRKDGSKPGALHQRTDVNVFRLDLDNIEKECAFATGDPFICRNCGVLLNDKSQLFKMVIHL